MGDREKNAKQPAPSLSALSPSSDQPSRVSCVTNSYNFGRKKWPLVGGRKIRRSCYECAQRGHCSFCSFRRVVVVVAAANVSRGRQEPLFELCAQLLCGPAMSEKLLKICPRSKRTSTTTPTPSPRQIGFTWPCLVEEHRFWVFVGEKLDVAQNVLLGDNAQDFPVVCD